MHVRGLATAASPVGAVNVTRAHEMAVEAAVLVRSVSSAASWMCSRRMARCGSVAGSQLVGPRDRAAAYRMRRLGLHVVRWKNTEG